MIEAVNEKGREAAHHNLSVFIAAKAMAPTGQRKVCPPTGSRPSSRPEPHLCYEWWVWTVRSLLIAAAIFGATLAFGPRASLAAPGGSGLAWQDCGDGFDCATLSVPLDYAAPGAGTLDLALIRLPANDPGQRIGSLLANPGGPGASGIDFVRAWAGSLDSNVRDRFDIVGFDPRGIGASSPIVCHDNLQAYIAADPTPDSQAEWDNLAEQTRQFSARCAQRYTSVLPHLGTKDVARDLDRIRAAVGDQKLTYVGYSYGTVIGQVYADMFPANVRAVVLDGAVDLALSSDERTLTQAMGFERALGNFLADCRQSGCPLTRRGDPAAAVDELLAKAEASPIPARGADRPAGPGEALLGLASALYSRSSWPELARAVVAGLDGDGTALVRLTDNYLDRGGDGSYPNEQEANLAVNCLDQDPSRLPASYDDYVAARAGLAARAAHFGPAFANGLTCASWAAKPDPLAAPKAAGAPPILVVDTTGDPATPYEWGVAVSKQLSTATLLTFNGEGHTAFGRDRCVNRVVNDYLLDLKVPPAGTSCGTASARPGTPPAEDDAQAPAAVAQSSGHRSTLAWAVAGGLVLFGALLGVGALVRWRRAP